MSSDMNLFDLLEDTFLKGDVKDELFDDNYGDDVIAVSLECHLFSAISSIMLVSMHQACGFYFNHRLKQIDILCDVYSTHRRHLFNIEIY